MLTDLASVAAEFWSCTVREKARWDLPPTLPHIPALAVAAHDHPASASQVGGDFYEVFALGAADGPSSCATLRATARLLRR